MASSVPEVVRSPVVLVLLVLVAICWPSSQASTQISRARPTPADAAAALLAGFLVARLLRPHGPAQLRSGWLAPVAALAATAGVSVFVAAAPVLALAGYVRFLEVFVLVPIAVAVTMRRQRDAV